MLAVGSPRIVRTDRFRDGRLGTERASRPVDSEPTTSGDVLARSGIWYPLWRASTILCLYAGEKIVNVMTAFLPLQVAAMLTVSSAWVAAAQRVLPDSTRVAARERDEISADLELAEVLRRAVEQHPLVEAARARVYSARGNRLTARTLPNPVFTVWAEDVRVPGGNGASPLDRETQTYATLPLEPLFQRWPRVRRAEAEVRAADADVARARQMVALDAARAFYRVAAAQVAADAADEIRARLAELVTYNSARVREGVAAEADLIRTQLELDRVAASVALERVALVRAKSELAPYLVGRPGADTSNAARAAGGLIANVPRVAVEDTVARSMGELRPLSEFVALARAARPDLAAWRARSDAASAEVTAQRTLTVRQVGATVGTKRRGGATSLLLGLSLPLPLFDQNRGEVQRATGERSAAEQELAWAERQAVAEVEAAYEAAQLLTEQADYLRGTFLARAEESRRIALAAYQEGAVSLLQVLDASRTLGDARLTYYRTIFAQRQSLLELNAAVGASSLYATPILRASTLSRPVRTPGDRP